MKTLLVLAATVSFLSWNVCAATRTWDGGGGDANFSTANNWNPNGVPANGDDLVFPAVAPNTVTNDLSGRTFGSLSFPAGTTLAGNPFTITGGINSAAVGPRSAVTIEPGVTLGANQTFTCGGAGSLTFEGGVSFGARTLTVTGARNCTFNGLTGGTAAGSRLIKTGTGTLRVNSTAIAITNQPWDVSAGTLDVDGTLQATVNLTGGRLTGQGSITGLNATGGDVEPDASGLQVAENATLVGTSRCLFHLIGPSDENTLECTGVSVTISGNATLVVDAVGYTPVWDEDFQLLTKSTTGAITGAFSNAANNAEVPLGATVGRAHYNGGNGNDLTLDIFSTTRQWDGGNVANDNWDEAENWTQNTRPNFGDVLDFPPGIQSTDRGLDNNFPNDTTFRQLVFRGDDYTVSGNRVRLSHGISLAAGVTTNLDTSVVLALDQTFTLDGTLHLDVADEIATSGRVLSLAGSGTMDGKIRGTGGVKEQFPGANVEFQEENDYSGLTTIEPGGTLRTGWSGGSGALEPMDGRLGSPTTETIVGGTLDVSTSVTAFARRVDEPLTILTGGRLVLFVANTGGELQYDGPILLADGGLHTIITTGLGYGKLSIGGAISGPGDLEITHDNEEEPLRLDGPQANTFTGPLRVEGGLILDKSTAGMFAVSGSRLTVETGLLETRQDEQIANNCHVELQGTAEFRVGNVTARTETIGALTLDGTPTVAGGSANSNFVVTGNITQTGNGRATIAMDTKVTAPLTLVNVAGSLQFNSDAATITRAGNAIIRKTGSGTLELLGNQVSVPIQIAEGSVLLRAVNTQPIFLEGGNLIGSGTASGGVTSTPGGGTVQPVGETSATAILATGPLNLNAGTTLQMQLVSDAAGTGFDQLSVTGSAGLGGATLSLQYLAGFNVAFGQSITLLANDGSESIIGSFAGLPQGTFIPVPAANGGSGWTISYTGADGTGNDVVLTRVSAPQPPSPPLPVPGNDMVLTRVSAPPVTPQFSAISLSEGTGPGGQDVVSIGVTAAQGASFTLQASVNLTTWADVQTITADGGGALLFTFNQAPGLSRRYFRLRP